jgi:hypothetical protein
LNPDISVVAAHANVAARAPAPASELLTNAKRLAQGLPPRSPHRRIARGAKPSSKPPTTKIATGYIQASNPQKNKIVGYVASKLNPFGEYGYTTTSKSEALKVQFTYDTSAPSTMDISILSGSHPASTPFFGAIQGFSSTSPNIYPGSANYLFLGPTAPTAEDAKPAQHPNAFTTATGIAEDVESWVWEFHPSTSTITAKYTNSDGSHPRTDIVLAPGEDVFALTADIAKFRSTYGGTEQIHFKFISA